MLLIISSSEDETVDYFLSKTNLNKSKFHRINTEDLHHNSLITIDFERDTIDHNYNSSEIDYTKIQSVWYRRPKPILIDQSSDVDEYELKFLERESEKLWSELFFNLRDARWANHPNANAGAICKPEQLFRAKEFGLSIPKTLISNSPASTYILFDINEAPLNEVDTDSLKSFVQKNDPERKGHYAIISSADITGSKEKNIELSDLRVSGVSTYLMEGLDIAPEQISLSSHGETKHFGNDLYLGENRRIVLLMYR